MRWAFIAGMFFVLMPQFLFAASLPTGAEKININITPSYPGPNEEVLFSTRTTAERGAYTYVWTANGVGVGSGENLTAIKVRTGPEGSRLTVKVQLVDSSGSVRGQSVYLLEPADVDIVWEAKTDVPFFYKGKPLPNKESSIGLLAVPHFGGDEGLVYTWSQDGRVLGELSGYERRYIEITPPRFKKNFTISVTAETKDGIVAAQSKVLIPTIEPRVFIYENRPLVGIMTNRTVSGTQRFTTDELSYKAFPFFFASEGLVDYNWYLNGAPFGLNTDDPSIATFRKAGEGSGAYSVSVVTLGSNDDERATKDFIVSLE